MKSLDLIVPCYNEAQALPLLMDALNTVCAGLGGYRCRFLFVDDGSSDETLNVIKGFAAADGQAWTMSFERPAISDQRQATGDQ